MASIDSFLGSSLGSLNKLNSQLTGEDAKMQKVVEYLYTLTEQLRYVLNNLDEDNLSDGVLVRSIEDATSGQFTTFEQTSDAITAIIAGLNAAQKAVRVVFDSDGLTIKNGGFKILDSNNQATMTVSNSGNVSIVGSYTSEAYLNGGDKQWAEWDESQINFYYKPDGEDTRRVAVLGQARNATSGVLGVTGSVYITENLDASTVIKCIDLQVNSNYGGCIYLKDIQGTTSGSLASGSLGATLSLNNTTAKKVVCSLGSLTYGGYLYLKNPSGTNKVRAMVSSGDQGVVYADAYNNNSSRRYKTDINDMTDEQARKLLDLQFVKFRYKDKDTYNYGLIAEDTDLEEVVMRDEQGRPDAIDYTKLIPYMGKLIQEQEKRIRRLEDERYNQ